MEDRHQLKAGECSVPISLRRSLQPVPKLIRFFRIGFFVVSVWVSQWGWQVCYGKPQFGPGALWVFEGLKWKQLVGCPPAGHLEADSY